MHVLTFTLKYVILFQIYFTLLWKSHKAGLKTVVEVVIPNLASFQGLFSTLSCMTYFFTLVNLEKEVSESKLGKLTKSNAVWCLILIKKYMDFVVLIDENINVPGELYL